MKDPFRPVIKVVGADSDWGIATAMRSNAALNSAVDVIGTHYPCGYLSAMTTCSSTADAPDLTATGGTYQLTLQPGRVYTVTTTTTGQGAGSAAGPRRAVLALPYADSLAGSAAGREAKYFASMNGAFETAACAGAARRWTYPRPPPCPAPSWSCGPPTAAPASSGCWARRTGAATPWSRGRPVTSWTSAGLDRRRRPRRPVALERRRQPALEAGEDRLTGGGSPEAALREPSGSAEGRRGPPGPSGPPAVAAASPPSGLTEETRRRSAGKWSRKPTSSNIGIRQPRPPRRPVPGRTVGGRAKGDPTANVTSRSRLASQA